MKLWMTGLAAALLAAGAAWAAPEPGYHIHPQAAPDGNSAVYYFRPGREPYAEIRRIDLETGAVTSITDGTTYDSNPVFAPDGTRIAYVSGRPNMSGQWDIVIKDLASGAESVIVEGPEREMHPAWSPDGKWIAFVRMADGGSEIWRVRTDGTDLQQVTATPAREFHPKWLNRALQRGHDGTDLLVFDSSTDAGTEIRTRAIPRGADTVDAPAETELVIAAEPGWRAGVPAPGPGGKTIAYVRNPEDAATGRAEIWLADTISGDRKRVFEAPEGMGLGGTDLLPDWSGILFHMGSGGSYSLYRVNLDGSGLTHLLE